MTDSERRMPIFARFLPREFRERVLEPSLDDLRIDEMTSGHGPWRRSYARLVLFAECCRIGIPTFVWRRGRLTPLGTTLVVAMCIAALVVQRMNYRSGGNGSPAGGSGGPSVPK